MLIPYGADSRQPHWIDHSDEKTILTSDMSGFTRLTRQFGIIHFAGLIIQMRHLFARVFAHYAADTWMTEADNCFALFPSPQHAVLAGLECAQITRRFNAIIPDPSFHIHMSGFGIDCGSHIIQDRYTCKLFGAAVDWACYLGEDEADNGEVLVSSNVVAQLSAAGGLRQVTFTERYHNEQVYYAASSDVQHDQVPLPTVDEMTAEPIGSTTEQGHTFIRSILRRAHASPAERSRIDQQLTTAFLNPGTAVMLGFDLAVTRAQQGPTGVIERTHQIIDMTHPVVKQHEGVAVEEFLFLFANAAQAFLAARQLKHEIEQFNVHSRDADKLPLTGIAAHSGDLLIVPGTNVHWGDPVNTASKLAEDIASQGELLITEPIHRDLQPSPLGPHYTCHPRIFTASRVELMCFDVRPISAP